MRVLVTGGAGFIGSNTVKTLLGSGNDVAILDSLAPRVHPSGKASVPPEAEFVQADINDRARLLPLLRSVDAVVHLAAYQDYMTDFSRFFSDNSAGTALIYELIVEHRLPIRRVVVASTQSVYGEGRYACPEHGEFWGSRSLSQLEAADWEVRCPACRSVCSYAQLVESQAKPATPYGISKLAAEQFALAMGDKYGIPTVCLRYSLVQGPGQSIHNAYSGIGRIFNQQLRHGQPPMIFEDGLQVRDFVHVEDVARANALVLDSDEAVGRVFNVGGERATTVEEYASRLAALFGAEHKAVRSGWFRVGDARHTFSNSDALLGIGWTRAKRIDDIIRDAKEWFQSQDNVDSYAEATERMRASGVLREIDRALGGAR